MKKLIIALNVLLILFITGCTTTPGGNKGVQTLEIIKDLRLFFLFDDWFVQLIAHMLYFLLFGLPSQNGFEEEGSQYGKENNHFQEYQYP